jgi:hypothetical protein
MVDEAPPAAAPSRPCSRCVRNPVTLAEWRDSAHIETMDQALRRIGLAFAIMAPLGAVAALAQTNTQAIQRNLGNLQSLPLSTEPYQRSTEDYLYRQQLRDQARQGQAQGAQTRQQLIDQSGQKLQQNLATQRQQQLQQQQQFYDYELQTQQQQLQRDQH